MTYVIVYDKKKCIGAGECEVLAPQFWKVQSNGKADLKGAVLNSEGKYELAISDAQFKDQNLVCGSCPVNCIKLVKR